MSDIEEVKNNPAGRLVKKNGQNGPIGVSSGTGKPANNYLKNPKPKGKDSISGRKTGGSKKKGG